MFERDPIDIDKMQPLLYLPLGFLISLMGCLRGLPRPFFAGDDSGTIFSTCVFCGAFSLLPLSCACSSGTSCYIKVMSTVRFYLHVMSFTFSAAFGVFAIDTRVWIPSFPMSKSVMTT